MIKPFLLLFLTFTCNVVLADTNSRYKLTDLRKEYLEASKNEKAGGRFYDKMSAYHQKDPIILAYKAASEAVMAKYVWNPYTKLKHLKAAASFFEDAVKLDKYAPEVRFLRFTVEFYVPRYLNLSEHLEEDKKVVILGLKQHPESGMTTELARAIREFMLSKDHCTQREKKQLEEIRI
ncbi:hypothetical protein ACSX1A_02020 [Pontibacter sp. MBLB2868]|uniref:hypothetical protein n=1 Tax=Pontibacter sp. MBLB2868 TaxID=3451555 RepID=UPI003F74FD39